MAVQLGEVGHVDKYREPGDNESARVGMRLVEAADEPRLFFQLRKQAVLLLAKHDGSSGELRAQVGGSLRRFRGPRLVIASEIIACLQSVPCSLGIRFVRVLERSY